MTPYDCNRKPYFSVWIMRSMRPTVAFKATHHASTTLLPMEQIPMTRSMTFQNYGQALAGNQPAMVDAAMAELAPFYGAHL